MAIAASLLRGEMRRHLLMNVSLVASCVVAGTVVTNERGLFVPLTTMSDTARAFSAMFTQSHLLPDTNDLTDVRMVSPLSAFEVTADSRDLRRRLMDALPATEDNNQETSMGAPLTFAEAGTLPPPLPNLGSGSGSGSGGGASGGSSPLVLADASTPTPKPADTSFGGQDPTSGKTTAETPGGTGAVPEPSTWAMLIAGFGFVGYFLRNARRRAREDAAAA